MTASTALRWRIANLTLWASLALALAGLAAVALFWDRGLREHVANNIAIVGGPFELRTAAGERVTRGDLLGRPHILYFGFTMCVDLCPTTLYQISSAMGALGHRADWLRAAFVTVDPQRDTPEVLRRYMSAFDPRMIALTGTPAEIAQAAGAYRIVYRKVDLGAGDYTMDHTPSALLFRADGTMAGTIAADATDESVRSKIAALVGEAG
jgi:protein SCO1/2